MILSNTWDISKVTEPANMDSFYKVLETWKTGEEYSHCRPMQEEKEAHGASAVLFGNSISSLHSRLGSQAVWAIHRHTSPGPLCHFSGWQAKLGSQEALGICIFHSGLSGYLGEGSHIWSGNQRWTHRFSVYKARVLIHFVATSNFSL